jgi:phosphoglucosamine mutase
VIGIGASPNGFNINDDVGATAPAALRRKVLDAKADIGIALDGDGDRLLIVDGKGQMYDGDQLLYVIACARATSQPVAGVVGTLMTNLGLEHALARRGIACARAKVGDRYVLESMQEKNWQLGGENSGHIICLDRHTTGDGIIAALQVLAALRRNEQTLEQACADLTLYPQKLVNVRVPAGFDWAADVGIQAAVKSAEQALAESGRVLLRPSGTEPLLRVMVEARDEALVIAQAERIATAVRAAIDHD